MRKMRRLAPPALFDVKRQSTLREICFSSHDEMENGNFWQ